MPVGADSAVVVTVASIVRSSTRLTAVTCRTVARRRRRPHRARSGRGSMVPLRRSALFVTAGATVVNRPDRRARPPGLPAAGEVLLVALGHGEQVGVLV